MKTAYLLTTLFVVSLGAVHAAPVPQGPPPVTPTEVVRWEYCEVQAKVVLGAAIRPVAAAGGAVPINPAAGAQPFTRLVTAGNEVEGTNWEDLATKMQIPDVKATEAKPSHKMRVFNKLGSEGWEVAEYHRDIASNADVWTFKRKAGKSSESPK